MEAQSGPAAHKILLLLIFSLGFLYVLPSLHPMRRNFAVIDMLFPFPSPSRPAEANPLPSCSTVAISCPPSISQKVAEDAPWENVESSSWSIAELCSGITCSCAADAGAVRVSPLPGAQLQDRTSGSSQSYMRQGKRTALQNRRGTSSWRQLLLSSAHIRAAQQNPRMLNQASSEDDVSRHSDAAAHRTGSGAERVRILDSYPARRDNQYDILGLQATVKTQVDTASPSHEEPRAAPKTNEGRATQRNW